MKKLAVFAVAAVLAVSAFANANWIGNSYFVIGGDQWYNGSGDGNQALPADLGTVSSLFVGGEVSIWEEGNVDWHGGKALLYASVDSAAATLIDLPYLSFSDNNNKMQNLAGVDIASGLAAGEHTVSLWFSDYNDDGPALWDSGTSPSATSEAGAAKWSTKFTTTAAVPEPATMSLLGLGALAMVLRRKLRK